MLSFPLLLRTTMPYVPKVPEQLVLAPLFAPEAAIRFLMERGILYETAGCSKCRRADMSRRGRIWRCTTKNCRHKISVFKGSFFAGARLAPHRILELAYYWLSGLTHSRITAVTHRSPTTVTEYVDHFQQLVGDTYRETQEPIGGPGVVVEIDESKFGKRKYHRGHRVDGVWVFGGVERTTGGRMFVEVVENRSEDVLLGVLERNVHPESIIHSDMWRGYKNIEERLGMEHHTVNHSKNFVDPGSGAHTNTIEGIWNGFKLRIPPRKRTSAKIGPALLETAWRRQNRDNDLWELFLEYLSDQV